MAKKINILKSGLPSKMYYLGFQKSMSIYAMSQKIHGKVQPQKLYKWRDELQAKGYFKEVEKEKWQSTATPIVEEIEQKTQKHFSDKQKQVLENFIDITFREYISHIQQDINEDFNGIDTLLNDLDLLLIQYTSTMRTHPGIPRPLTIQDYEKWQKKVEKEDMKQTKELLVKTGLPVQQITKIKRYNIFLPMDLIDLIKGFSSLGKKYELFTKQIEITNMIVEKAIRLLPGTIKGFRVKK